MESMEVIALPMAPFQSRASTGAYIEEVNRVKKNMGEEIEVSFVRGLVSAPSLS